MSGAQRRDRASAVTLAAPGTCSKHTMRELSSASSKATSFRMRFGWLEQEAPLLRESNAPRLSERMWNSTWPHLCGRQSLIDIEEGRCLPSSIDLQKLAIELRTQLTPLAPGHCV